MNLTNKTAALIPLDDPSPLAFFNVYEVGDVWVKVRGCEDCPPKSRANCCGTCPMSLKDTGECRLHIGENKREKPVYCATYPPPNVTHSWCALEFKCVFGTHKGKIRRVRDRKGFVNDNT